MSDAANSKRRRREPWTSKLPYSSSKNKKQKDSTSAVHESANESANEPTNKSKSNRRIAIIDMGSNGIRFGIIASLDRHLPVLYEERASISLFDAQWGDGDDDDDGGDSGKKQQHHDDVGTNDNEKAPAVSERQPIPSEVIEQVIQTFKRWKALCDQAKVKQVRVIATEATRTAPNSEEFLTRIKQATGWDVELLSKAQEATIGAAGVMASYSTVRGLFMDLGGGSVQLNYIIRDEENTGKSSRNAQSWPYGAAALSRRLNNCRDEKERNEIIDEMEKAFEQGLKDIEVDPAIKKDFEDHGGKYNLYLSGGGFRALGYLIMDHHSKKGKGDNKESGKRYPIPIINGLTATDKELREVVDKYRDMKPEEVSTAFRISKRRAKQVPACATLMAAVMKVIPIREVYFSEGGVRQGGCFEMLSKDIKNRDPALCAASAFAKSIGQEIPEEEAKELSESILQNLHAIAGSSSNTSKESGDVSSTELQKFLGMLPRLVPIMVVTTNCYLNMPKEARSTAAFHLFLPGGALANCPGLTHTERAILATVLAERHGGDLADPEMDEQIKKLIPGGKLAKHMCKYLGRSLVLIGLHMPLPGTARPGTVSKILSHFTKRFKASRKGKNNPSSSLKSDGVDTNDVQDENTPNDFLRKLEKDPSIPKGPVIDKALTSLEKVAKKMEELRSGGASESGENSTSTDNSDK